GEPGWHNNYRAAGRGRMLVEFNTVCPRFAPCTRNIETSRCLSPIPAASLPAGPFYRSPARFNWSIPSLLRRWRHDRMTPCSARGRPYGVIPLYSNCAVSVNEGALLGAIEALDEFEIWVL